MRLYEVRMKLKEGEHQRPMLARVAANSLVARAARIAATAA